jgi:hypothetical protein
VLRRVALLLAASTALLAAPATAYADPSAIGDGSVVDDGDYIGSANPDPTVEATAGSAKDDACVAVSGQVTPTDAADAQRSLLGAAPVGAGQWRYLVCAADKTTATTIARLHPTAASAKAYCRTATGPRTCAVVTVWDPDVDPPSRPAKNPPKKLGAFSGWLDFTPDLATSPSHQDALVAQLPTWVWDRNTADVRGICLPIFGGVCGFATRLGTTWETEGTTFCRSPGTRYDPGRDDPRSASSCGWTYQTSGTYGIRGCKNWLVIVWRLPWMIPIVFPLELCNTDQVAVQEAQILSGQPPR